MRAGWFKTRDCGLDAFKAHIAQARAGWRGAPSADDKAGDIPVYDCARLRGGGRDETIMMEWSDAMMNGPGVIALRGAMADIEAVDAATEAYNAIIKDERERGAGQGDHFAASGANDRVWNALEKLCKREPEVFARYHGEPMLDLACRAWLGPNYQMTTQINLVRPGGAAQQPHRDYHLGFMSLEDALRYPISAHLLSPHLTLQGAIAHCDMPIESGPTQLLPFSQSYAPGYLAPGLPEFRDYANAHFVQIPLQKGDAVFFNPALFHAAGANKSADIHRMANLIQASSAFGRSIEAVDRAGMCRALYPVLARLRQEGALDAGRIEACVAASAEGYAFPTNLDNDPPVGGLSPRTQAGLMHEALEGGWPTEEFNQELAQMAERREP